ncbi:probable G-protein coupled receptor 160 [Callorhinchus milii]|uniref:probable G-protein coupled receptor 160 n=1 Tax=Callorhinchus milii TaxID=7868 RepID=UPI001C3FB713|nr:probable G-protein coupled receptor 160 [Callorhinchus milii]
MLVLLQSSPNAAADREAPLLNTTEIIFLLLLKCVLNYVSFYFANKSLWRSIVGAFTVTLCASDLLLFGTVLFLSSETPDIKASVLCSVLQFFSGMYTGIHAPIFILTVVDNYYNLQAEPCLLSRKKSVGYWLAVVAVWAAAITYMLQSTSISGLQVLIHDNLKVQFCPIHSTDLILICSLVMMAFSVLVGLSAWWSIPAFALSMRVSNFQLFTTADEPPSLQSNVFISCKEPRESPLLSLPTQDNAPLLLCIAISFLCNWMPFMMISSVCILLRIPVPAYISMNTFFLLCFNSFAIRVLYWCKAGQLDSAVHFPEPIYDWNICRSMCRPRTHEPSSVPQPERTLVNVCQDL